MSQLINGDCLEEMKKLPVNSIDTIITDPPYGLEFMGKGWDKGAPGAEYLSARQDAPPQYASDG